jgi:hypothetical protein
MQTSDLQPMTIDLNPTMRRLTAYKKNPAEGRVCDLVECDQRL